ncbi:hypothetical protein F2Q70_00024566 [Brassica cretica]|uniref:Methyltransferase domain-containing protein n=1 Tax=Brassica cretica TaxID=69181 RepID=A0A8S9LE23_BRACR|nr:hypothetical protein F2Q70_00024566 [Brassica cretica]
MALRFPQLLKVAEEQQYSKYSSGGKMIPTPEEAATFQPQVVAEGGWEKCWEDGVTPWDQGRATPLILHLLDSSSLPLGRTLVPGCGGGHDVVAMANPERFVVGLDISEKALKKASETYGSAPNAKYFAFMKEDFFTWRPDELFDLIFDYVFFCAIEPEMRPAWAKSMYEVLKPEGELITLMYEAVLVPLGFKAVSIEENPDSIPTREREAWEVEKDQLIQERSYLNYSLVRMLYMYVIYLSAKNKVILASTSPSTDTGSEIPIVDIDIIPQQKDNNHAKQIVSPALEHNLEVDVYHLSAPTVDRDDTENPLYATLSSSSLVHQENPTAAPNSFNTLSTSVDSQSIPTTTPIIEFSPSNIINSEVCETLVVGPLTTTLNPCAFENPSRFTVLRDVDEVVLEPAS